MQSDQVALWNSYLFLISNNVGAIFSIGDTLNWFCLFIKPRRVVNHLLFLTDKTKLDGTPIKIKWRIHAFWYTVFYVFKVFLIEEYKIKLVCQFLYFLLFYIASEFTSADIIFNIHWKKIFATNFYFLTDSPTFIRWWSLNLENFWFYIWVVVL